METLDKYLMVTYLIIAVVLILCGIFFWYTVPTPDCYGNVGYPKIAAAVTWVSALICFGLAENRRSGWFFWL